VAPVDVVDEVGRRRVQGRRERRHEGREQSRDDQPEHAGRRELADRRRQDAVVVGSARRDDAEVVEIGDRKHGEAGDQQVTDRHQHDRHEAAHQRRLARRARGEDLLHVVVGGGAGGADQDALEQHHHHESAEQRETVARDLLVERGEVAGPVEVEGPGEEGRVPAGRHERVDRRRVDALDGDDGDDHRDDRHQDELQHVGPDDAEHAAEHGVDHRQGGEGDAVDIGDVRGRDVEGDVGRDGGPGQENPDELADAHESVGQEPEHAQHREADHDELRELSAGPAAEARLDPLGAGQRVRAAQPARQVDHQEDLVENRPDPRDPDALQPVHDAERDEPHRPGDVVHVGGVGEAEHVPGHALVGEVVGLQAAGGAPACEQTNHDGRQHVQAHDGQVDGLHARDPPDLACHHLIS
jgi:hypothetical protein